ncbi:RagB/SusD family nutrient uptake outer membrane protein [Niabella beijingensis]|uniref:RagB/SusD family nutrient uptake outer membrane protein n=1 Tax=Niabella beijingensis TaxID=2872700 RepID=UPI001CBDF045|nr:RagB/SusD family nutrient uptake outer membrane protein [Niabella beijingensis]MBZ4187334.1 RagB/SusD family nutrient uptake outer membrane protein [Niabella beijingensis]
MKQYKIYYALAVIMLTGASCKGFLDVNPKGVLSESQITTPADAEKFVIAAYAYMPTLGYGDTHNPWIQDVRSDDSYKGGGGLNDQVPWHEMEIFTLLTPNVGNNDGPWYRGYSGVSRTNIALRRLEQLDETALPTKPQRIAEMRFVRGWIYLGMKLRWKYIPWIDETTPEDAVMVEGISNRPDSMKNDLGLWDKIIEDLEYAANVLPDNQQDVGRPTKYAAHALAAKALLFRAYEQNDRHQVVNINQGTLNRALEHINVITAKDGALFDLQPDFAENYIVDYDNTTKESIWELQYSISNSGVHEWTGGMTNIGNELNAPWWAGKFPCCDFHKVTHTLINAFKTDGNGLPDFVNYNNTELKNEAYINYFKTHDFDPRLSHTASIPGYPWKYDNSILYEEGGSRSPFQYGFFNSKKEQVEPNCNCLYKPFYTYNSLNEKVIRYSEVLLWKAEILIQQGNLMGALQLINRVRERAAKSTSRLKKPDGTYWMKYHVALYQPGVNCTWNKDFAWNALMWENRLETACEGRRFFDLMRWGQLEPVMNAHFAKERGRFDWFGQAHFTAGRDEYLPIPQPQMNWSHGGYKQNPGY